MASHAAQLTADLLVIGWGKVGKTLARVLGSAGQRVVLVQRSTQMYGGTDSRCATASGPTLTEALNEVLAGLRPVAARPA